VSAGLAEHRYDAACTLGGSPGTIALVLGYLFETPGLSLFDVVARSGDRPHFACERPAVAGRDSSRPVYVLTAARTFSAGDGLAYLLQERKRATVVGEATAGVANPGRPYPLVGRLEVTVPNGEVRSSVSGRNWEGRGVVPDVAVPADEALRRAHLLALTALIAETPDGAWHDGLVRTRDALERSPIWW
jgi:C-terminal processing protease CtpA/Prc